MLPQQPKARNRGNINFIVKDEICFYQRSIDGFFNLSDASRQIYQKPNCYLGLVSTLLIFISTKPNLSFGKLTVSNLLENFPDLITCDRNSGVESGLWLDSRFLDSFIQYAKEIRKKHWYYFLEQIPSMQYLHSIPLNYYEFLVKKPAKTKTILIRENDGFVYSQAFFHSGRHGEISALLSDGCFVSALHLVHYQNKQKIADLSYLKKLNSQTKLIYQIFKEYLDITLSKRKAYLWVNPQVASIYGAKDQHMLAAIEDWRYRQQQQNKLKITLYSLAKQPIKATEHPLLAFRSTLYDLHTYETPKQIYLRVVDTKRQWQFALDLVTGLIYFDQDLLAFWGLPIESDTVPDVDYLYSTAELQRRNKGNNPLDRILYNCAALKHLEITQKIWNIEYQAQKYNLRIPESLAITIPQVIDKYQTYFSQCHNTNSVKKQIEQQ